MAVARCVEDFTNETLLSKFQDAIQKTTENAYPVRSVSQQDPHGVLFFAEQIRERVAEGGLSAADRDSDKMLDVVRTVAGMPPALRNDYRQVAGKIQEAEIFQPAAEDKWTMTSAVAHRTMG